MGDWKGKPLGLLGTIGGQPFRRTTNDRPSIRLATLARCQPLAAIAHYIHSHEERSLSGEPMQDAVWSSESQTTIASLYEAAAPFGPIE